MTTTPQDLHGDSKARSKRILIAPQLVGGWKLVSYSEINADTGDIHFPLGSRAIGLILYTPDGYMSAQISAPERADFAGSDMFDGTAEEYLAAGQTCMAYSGRYEVDEPGQIVSHDVAISFFPNWVEHRQVRRAEITGDRLTLSFEKPRQSNGALIRAELVWER